MRHSPSWRRRQRRRSNISKVSHGFRHCLTEDDLWLKIKEELIEFGYIKRKRRIKSQNQEQAVPLPLLRRLWYYVGKNNYQNDELTFKFATGNDWWFHAKGMPGSRHRKSNNEELPSRFRGSWNVAGYYSKDAKMRKWRLIICRKMSRNQTGLHRDLFVYYTNTLTIHPSGYFRVDAEFGLKIAGYNPYDFYFRIPFLRNLLPFWYIPCKKRIMILIRIVCVYTYNKFISIFHTKFHKLFVR